MARVRLEQAEVEVPGAGTVTYSMTSEGGRTTGVRAETRDGHALLSVLLDDAMRVTVAPVQVRHDSVDAQMDGIRAGAMTVLRANPAQLGIAVEDRIAMDMESLRRRVTHMEAERTRGGMSDAAVSRSMVVAMAYGGRMGALANANRAMTEFVEGRPFGGPPDAFGHGDPDLTPCVERSRPGALGGALVDAIEGTVSVVPIDGRGVALHKVAQFAREHGYEGLQAFSWGEIKTPSHDRVWSGDVHAHPARFAAQLASDGEVNDRTLVTVSLVPPSSATLRDVLGRLTDAGADPVVLAFGIHEAHVGRASALAAELDREPTPAPAP